MDKTNSKYRIVEVTNASRRNAKSSILIIYTGGTLGMEHDKTGALVALNFNQIVRRAPALKNLNLRMTVISFPNPIDSSNITYKEWQNLGTIIYENHHHYNGFVVLHGTDTMSFSVVNSTL